MKRHSSFRSSLIYNQSLIGEKRLFLREQKQTACVHRRALRLCTTAQTERCASVTRFAARQILAVLLNKTNSVDKATAKRALRRPRAFVHNPKTSSHCASFTRFVARQILQGLQIKLFLDNAQSQTRLSSFAQAKLGAFARLIYIL